MCLLPVGTPSPLKLTPSPRGRGHCNSIDRGGRGVVPGPRDSHVGDDSLTIPGPPTGHLGRTLGPRPLLRPA